MDSRVLNPRSINQEIFGREFQKFRLILRVKLRNTPGRISHRLFFLFATPLHEFATSKNECLNFVVFIFLWTHDPYLLMADHWTRIQPKYPTKRKGVEWRECRGNVKIAEMLCVDDTSSRDSWFSALPVIDKTLISIIIDNRIQKSSQFLDYYAFATTWRIFSTLKHEQMKNVCW